jgi:hypothetical protein
VTGLPQPWRQKTPDMARSAYNSDAHVFPFGRLLRGSFLHKLVLEIYLLRACSVLTMLFVTQYTFARAAIHIA